MANAVTHICSTQLPPSTGLEHIMTHQSQLLFPIYTAGLTPTLIQTIKKINIARTVTPVIELPNSSGPNQSKTYQLPCTYFYLYIHPGYAVVKCLSLLGLDNLSSTSFNYFSNR
ncbi:hypothetical protein GDO78_011002 [Eleutherodactylus coqui]|uniref:Uncharacterized protein n=1 Tax=Eleutherodactylus coqui TaxID=57060 RepID=A0A8J6K6X1_ELECQ|nr:hypothetical protein GDO78_011002 [Eleutherodactylus coqui]